jgi:PHD/YefM family antitoxin component YafN of YafNO toxin-antitoxin module
MITMNQQERLARLAGIELIEGVLDKQDLILITNSNKEDGVTLERAEEACLEALESAISDLTRVSKLVNKVFNSNQPNHLNSIMQHINEIEDMAARLIEDMTS